jgi:hypothetical protein
VPHSGRYDDPFDLADEVRFVVASGGELVDLIAASVAQSLGRFVHIMHAGLTATPGWTERALENFEHHDAATIAPVIRDRASRRVIAAGWRDSGVRFFRPVAAGTRSILPQVASMQIGSYLHASFWRRDVLRSLLAAYDASGDDPTATAVSYAFQFLLSEAGWRSVLAADCDVLADEDLILSDPPSFGRGRRLGAIKRYFDGSPKRLSVSDIMGSMFACVKHPATFAEVLGKFAAGGMVDPLHDRIHASCVMRCRVEETIVPITERPNTSRRRTA